MSDIIRDNQVTNDQCKTE